MRTFHSFKGARELKREILELRDAISNKQECIAIMLLCLDHGHSEYKQKADLHGYSY